MDANLDATALAVTRGAIRAAQYLRMSTDHQRYSTANQDVANRAYADANGVVIVRTYSDEGRSGLVFEGRDALAQLIDDVQSGNVDFEVILVYDISRWGRFQDPDEAAYYEFICKRNGVTVHYCAEQFENDGSLLSTIAKTLKRAQAADYSRELSVKVFAGQRRLCEMGFALGGAAGYGLRRLLVDDHGIAKCELSPGQWKSIASDRIILVLGPPAEVETVRRIFVMFARERLSEARIARTLNAEGVAGPRGNYWRHQTVNYLLRSEKYIGNLVWNRHSFKLKKIHVRNKPESWHRVDGAWKAIVERPLYEAVQAQFRTRAQYTCGGRPKGLSDEDMLAGLRQLLTERGRLSRQIIDEARHLPSCATYESRFGGLGRLYPLVGFKPKYKTPEHRGLSDEVMLAALRGVLQSHGYLSGNLIDTCEGIPSSSAYYIRFGSFRRAYAKIGYHPPYPARPRGLTDEQMLEALEALRQRHGYLSRSLIDESESVPCSSLYAERFGGLMGAYRRIGLTGDRYASVSPHPRGLCDDELLEALRRLLRDKGSLSLRILCNSKGLPSHYAYKKRFGTLLRAYQLIGYTPGLHRYSQRRHGFSRTASKKASG